jgi:L-rhamnose mutarotase
LAPERVNQVIVRRSGWDAITQEWWALCMPMMAPLETRKDGEFWAEMDRIFLMEE